MNLTYANVDQLCAGVGLAEERPLIDLQSVTFIEPFALIYLGMFLRFHNATGKFFELRPPESRRARDYIESQNFWERFNVMAEPSESAFRRFGTNTSFNDIVDIESRVDIADDISLKVRELLRRNRDVRVNIDVLETLVAELVDNFQQHADVELAACAVQWYPRLGRVDFAIGDCGIGIRSSLSEKKGLEYLLNRSHREAAVKALEPLVSRKSEGGMGLTEVTQAIEKLDGHFFLSTGDGWVSVDRDGIHLGQQHYDLPGVQIEVSIPTGP